MDTNNPFYEKTVAATGKLEKYTRDGIQSKLLSLGATPSGTVNANTDYLIVGEKAGSKLNKAQEFGVKTLSEAEFEAMLTSGTQTSSIGGAIIRKMIQMAEGAAK